jgi:hypothetical protein
LIDNGVLVARSGAAFHMRSALLRSSSPIRTPPSPYIGGRKTHLSRSGATLGGSIFMRSSLITDRPNQGA